MARRVNTKFVIGLSSVLVIGMGGALYVVGSYYFKQRNPVYLTARAQEAEKKGDLNVALSLYSRAAQRAVEKHTESADEMCMRAGDLAMKMSETEKERLRAQSLYASARQAWEMALTENPHFLPARDKLTEDQYQTAITFGQPAMWTALEQDSTKLIEISPKTAKAYAYRAEAQLELLRLGAAGGDSLDGTITSIQRDLKKATELDPGNTRAATLTARLLWDVQAARANSLGQTKEATQFQDSAIALLKDFLKKNPNSPDATISLAQAYQSRKMPDDALKLLETAYAAHPENLELANTLWRTYAPTSPEKAAVVIKQAIASDPGNTEEYLVLGNFYEAIAKGADSIPNRKLAIQAFQDSLLHPKTGGGMISYENDLWEAEAKYHISSLYMDIAEIEGVATAAGKADLMSAADYADKFRSSKSDIGRQNVLDGRLQLMHQNIAQAIVSLKRADANMGARTPTAGRQIPWLQTKMLPVRAYEQQQEWGLALQYLEQVLGNTPNNIIAAVERASLLNRVAHYAQALAAIDPILHVKLPPSDEGKAIEAKALKVKADALYGLGQRDDADKIVASLDSTDGTLSLAGSHISQGEYEAALEELQRVFDKDPTSLQAVASSNQKPQDADVLKRALSLAVIANVQLDRKAEAQKLLDVALAKFPSNAGFQVMRAQLSKPEGETAKGQEEIINSITDEYVRAMTFAQMYRRAGQPEKELASIQTAEKVLDAQPSPAQATVSDTVERGFSLVLALGSQAQNDKDKAKYWDIAQTYVQKAQRYNLDGVDGKLYAGRLQCAQGNTRDGLQTLEQAMTLRPDYSIGRTILGQAYMSVQRNSDAVDQFRQAIQEKPDNLPALKSMIYILTDKGDTGSLQQAATYLKQALLFSPYDAQLTEFRDTLAIKGAGDLADAIRVREDAFKKRPEDISNLKRLAGLYVSAKEPSKAIDLLLPLYQKNPDDIGVADTLAHLYSETQQTNTALTIYERFLGSKDEKIRFNATLRLGELYQSMAQMDKAAQTYQEAIKMESAGSDQAERRLADMYFDNDDMDDAIKVYQQIYGNTKDVLVLRRIIEAEIRSDKYADADKSMASLFAGNPQDESGLVLQGFSYLKQGKAADALKNFNSVIDKDPNNLDALHYRAFSQFTLQMDLDQATKDLLVVRDRNPSATNSRLLLARVYRASHHIGEANTEYKSVVDLRPEYVPARLEYAEFLMNLAKIQQYLLPENQDDIAYTIRSINPSETLRLFLIDSANRFPTDPRWEVMAGDLLALNGRTAQAQGLYAQAFNISNGSPMASTAYLGSLLKTRNYEDVITIATKILTVRTDDVDVYVKRATAYAALNKSDEAEKDFDKAMDLGEKDAMIMTSVARDRANVTTPAQSLAALQTRLTAKPKDVVIRAALGQTLLLAGKLKESVGILSQLRDEPEAQPIRNVVMRALASAQYQLGDYEAAAAIYKDVLKANPSDIEALNNLSFLLANDMKKPKDAMVYADQAMKVIRNSDASLSFVNNGNVYDTYGWVEFLSGNVDDSIRDLKRAIESAQIPMAYLHLAHAYEKAGNHTAATKAVQDGLQLANEQKDPVGPQLEAFQKELAK